jgi:hypothetical protein
VSDPEPKTKLAITVRKQVIFIQKEENILIVETLLPFLVSMGYLVSPWIPVSDVEIDFKIYLFI